ncbi:MAG: DUF393 domain-containing protein [Halobacteriovoraceae bacterium]|jgi:predicted DCC family thiol-disulfide oxidoreductase YuxK|nr:DUF393 domain-containing protein [Halobacteriovoraceae bacterium]
MDTKITILFDSECDLCIRFKKALSMLDSDKKIAFRAVQDQSVYLDFPELKQDECEEEIHLIDTKGKVHRGREVVEYLILFFPAVKKFAWLIENDSAKSAMDAFYKRINKMRIMKKRKCYTCGDRKKQKR